MPNTFPPGDSSVPTRPLAVPSNTPVHHPPDSYGYVLEVGAMKNESDALALADQVRQKHFAVFVTKSQANNFYRVWGGIRRTWMRP